MTTPTFVLATDAALSGWGLAPRRSIVAVECQTPAEVDFALAKLRARPEMRRPRVAASLPRQRDGQHISILRRDENPIWFPPATNPQGAQTK